ncbi:MAG: hypothetical protein OEV78_11120 [Spirochaetia bacterium]|nr:hypothetical protein [Spirochaetia bacterium]
MSGYFGDESRSVIYDTIPKINIEEIKSSINDIRDKLKKGLTAKDLSIKKWIDIRNILLDLKNRKKIYLNEYQFKKNFGYHTCAFCIAASDVYRKKNGELQTNKDKCTECPLAVIDCCLNENSMYNKFLKDYGKFSIYCQDHNNIQFLKVIIKDTTRIIRNLRKSKNILYSNIIYS